MLNGGFWAVKVRVVDLMSRELTSVAVSAASGHCSGTVIAFSLPSNRAMGWISVNCGIFAFCDLSLVESVVLMSSTFLRKRLETTSFTFFELFDARKVTNFDLLMKLKSVPNS